MPLKIVAPKLEDYPIAQQWLGEAEKHYLKILNNLPRPQRPSEAQFEDHVLRHLQTEYPISMDDLRGAKVYVEINYALDEY